MPFTLMTREGEAPGLWAFTADRDATLDDLQGKIGGLIQAVGYGGARRRFGGLNIAMACGGEMKIDDWICLADEEGLIKDLPVNRWASVLCGQPIVGDAVIVPVECFK